VALRSRHVCKPDTTSNWRWQGNPKVGERFSQPDTIPVKSARKQIFRSRDDGTFDIALFALKVEITLVSWNPQEPRLYCQIESLAGFSPSYSFASSNVHSLRRTLCLKAGSLLLLGCLFCGILAPAAVAYSSDEIVEVAGREGLSSDVHDFFLRALEDAMLRSAVVAPVVPTLDARKGNESRPTIVISRSAVETSTAVTRSVLASDQDINAARLVLRSTFLRSSVRPLGP